MEFKRHQDKSTLKILDYFIDNKKVDFKTFEKEEYNCIKKKLKYNSSSLLFDKKRNIYIHTANYN